MPDLSLKNINKFYGKVHAVKNISIDVPIGEFVVLVGPSGCGKSTLLRCIAGLEDISDGDALTLPAGQFSRVTLQVVIDIKKLGRPIHLFFDFCLRHLSGP